MNPAIEFQFAISFSTRDTIFREVIFGNRRGAVSPVVKILTLFPRDVNNMNIYWVVPVRRN